MTNSAKEIEMPFFSKRQQKKRTVKKVDSKSAKDVIGPIEKGCEIFGLTKGEISIIDIIEYALSVTGPADVTISTWAAAQKSIIKAQQFIHDGRIKNFRFLIDPSFKDRKNAFCEELAQIFGAKSIRTLRNHAKFILISNDSWKIVIRTSMNLNQNPRMEFVEISDCGILFGFMNDIVTEIFLKISVEDNFQRNKKTNETILSFDSPNVKRNLFDDKIQLEFEDIDNIL